MPCNYTGEIYGYGQAMVTTILLLAAFLCFLLAFLLPLFNASTGKLDLIALGLTCWVLTVLMGAWPS